MASEVVGNGNDSMSKEERKVYDRQIRLWGFEGQNKIRTTKVLVIGMQGLGAEIAKNFILAGIHSITLKDHTDVSILDHCSQYLIPRDSEERNRAKASLDAAQKLNSNVKVLADTVPIEENVDNFVENFDIVVATECSPDTYKRLNLSCRKAEVKLFIADVYGLFGYFFQDVEFKHNYYHQVFPSDQSPPKGRLLPYYLTTALLRFQNDSNRKPNPDTSEEDLIDLKSIILGFDKDTVEGPDALDEYYDELFCELCPTTSIVGAMVVQTAINAVMNKPLSNFNVFFYDHIEHDGRFHLL